MRQGTLAHGDVRGETVKTIGGQSRIGYRSSPSLRRDPHRGEMDGSMEGVGKELAADMGSPVRATQELQFQPAAFVDCPALDGVHAAAVRHSRTRCRAEAARSVHRSRNHALHLSALRDVRPTVVASFNIISTSTPTTGATSILLMTRISQRKMPGPFLRGMSSPPRDVDHEQPLVDQVERERRREVVAAAIRSI